jgi:hypothetical protein
MRNMTFALVVLLAGAAQADKDKPKDAAAAAKATLDKADEAFNKQDAKGLTAMLDKTYFGGGPTNSSKFDSPETMGVHFAEMLAHGGHLTRNAVTIKADEDGGTAWYIAEYLFVPKVGPGVLPVRRPMRESGVLVKRGKDWKFAMLHMSQLQPDPPPAEKTAPPPPVTPPSQK